MSEKAARALIPVQYFSIPFMLIHVQQCNLDLTFKHDKSKKRVTELLKLCEEDRLGLVERGAQEHERNPE